jgi:hypothetical protein
VPLQYWRSDFANTNFGWFTFPPVLSYTALPAGQEWLVRLGAKLPAGPIPPDTAYQSLLEITDDAGTRWLLPLSATSSGTTTASGAGGFAAAAISAVPQAGVWIGEAVLRAVSQPARVGDSTTPRPAGEFTFRLIVHVDATGATRLLQQIHLVRKPPVLGPDPENPEFNRVEVPARVLALTDENLIATLIGPGEIVGRRVSSAAFAFKDPVVLSGGAFGSGTIAGSVPLDYRHRLNPFQHRFHPDHNNLDERFEQTVAEGKESFTVTRTISLEFSSIDPLGLTPPGWGDSELGGVYRETFTGLHRSPIQVAGTFRLVRAATAPELNQ